MKLRILAPKPSGWLVLPLLLCLTHPAAAAPGDLDPTFAGTGKTITAFGYGQDAARAAEVQADGKLVIAGFSESNPGNQIEVVRFNLDHTLDPTFGSGGRAITAFNLPGSTSGSHGYAMKIQADGKIVVAGVAFGNGNGDFVVVRYDTNGQLDPTFSGDGIQTIDFGGTDTAFGVAIQADGKIVVAGKTTTGTGGIAVARLNTNGTLDTSFDGDGKATTLSLNSNTAATVGLVLQSNGRIVVTNDAGNRFTIVRYNTNGSLDTTFSGDGIQQTQFPGSASCPAYAVTMQPPVSAQPERIVVVGLATVSGVTRFALARYDLNGTLDATFDGDGLAVAQVPGANYNIAQSVLVQGTQITVAGLSATSSGATPHPSLAKFNLNGSLDTSFSGDGLVWQQNNTIEEMAFALTVESGALLVAGYGWSSGSNRDFLLMRFATNGTLDPTFDGDGLKSQDVGDVRAFLSNAVLQADGKVLVAGTVDTQPTRIWGLARYHTTGALDASFGEGGKLATGLGELSAVAVQPDGKIVGVGSFRFANDDFSIWRLNADGSPDETFGGNDLVNTPIGAGDDQAKNLALQSDGKIVVVGTTHNGSNLDAAVVRYLPDGTLDPTFSGDGITTVAIAAGDDYASGVCIQPDGKIVVLTTSQVGASFDVGLFRLNANGTLDNSFGSFGRVATDIGSGSMDGAITLALQPDGKLVVSGYTLAANYEFAMLRYLPNGTLDTSFDGDGKVVTPIGISDDLGVGLAIQPDGKYLQTGYAVIGADVEFVVARYETNGALDGTYGFGGKVAYDFDGQQDIGYVVMIDAVGRAIVACSTADRFGLARLDGDATNVGVFDGWAPLEAVSGIRSITPNPAFGRQVFEVELAAGAPAGALEVYSVTGQRLWSRDLKGLAPGRHRFEWDGRGADGAKLAPGVYFARVEGVGASIARRVVRIR